MSERSERAGAARERSERAGAARERSERAGAAPTAPFGTWPSPITAARIVEGAARVGEVRVDGGDVWWSEGRPAEGGRTQLVRRTPDGTRVDVLPAPEPDGAAWNARTAVHEYGGAAWCVRRGVVWFANWTDQRWWRLDADAGEGATPRPVTPKPTTARGVRFADAEVTADGRWLIAVRESHEGAGEARNEIVAVPADGSAAEDPSAVRVLVTGPDFVAAPTVSPDGSALAWVEWDHPDMPWDATELRVGAVDTADPGPVAGEVVAGGSTSSAVGPRWAEDGTLLVCWDRTGWWNPYRAGALEPGPPLDDDGVGDGLELVVESALESGVEGEIGGPAWVFGSRWLAPLDDGRIAASCSRHGLTELVVIDPPGLLRAVDLPFTEVSQVVPGPAAGEVVVVAGAPDETPAVWRVPLDADDQPAPPERLSRAPDLGVGPEWFSTPESISFPTGDGETAHGLYYRPVNPEVAAPAGERPPLLVLIHGGPTSAARPVLDLAKQFWTSRGFAVVDVNYRGSTGFGRPYRDALRGEWGVADVEDCQSAARYLAGRGDVDPERLAIRGGSAGGFTTLAALAFSDTFDAGASHFGVADLGALARDTHKFESRYLDGLVGPWPGATDVYEARSPVFHTDGFDRPLIVFQGLEDEVVPPAQAEAIVAALAAKGVPHAYVPFAGEQHGFRRAENIVRALEAELWFYGRVFGFEPADPIEPVAGAVGL